MTMLELQDILGKSIEEIINTDGNTRKHSEALQNAEYIAKLSKQMVNNADVVLRTDKMCGTKERINAVVGEVNNGK